MVAATYGLEQFVADMRELVAARRGDERLFERGAAYLERLLRTRSAIDERYLRLGANPTRPDVSMFALHRSPGLFVSSVVWGAGVASSIHDHGTWGLVGVLDSEIEETRYRRVDDRRDPNVARLERDRVIRSRSGEVSLLRPDIDEIHRMHNTTGRPTAEVHVYGLDLSRLAFNTFDETTGAIRRLQPRGFDNC